MPPRRRAPAQADTAWRAGLTAACSPRPGPRPAATHSRTPRGEARSPPAARKPPAPQTAASHGPHRARENHPQSPTAVPPCCGAARGPGLRPHRRHVCRPAAPAEKSGLRPRHAFIPAVTSSRKHRPARLRGQGHAGKPEGGEGPYVTSEEQTGATRL